MGSDQCHNIPSKPRRYDITMSRRTRKPLMNLKETDQNLTIGARQEGDAAKDAGHDQGADNVLAKACDHEEGETRKSSLKQLIMMKNAGNEESEGNRLLVEETRVGDDENIESKLSLRGRNSLGQHFKGEEKQQLQLAVTTKQAKEGARLKGMVGRYVKVVSHLIRVKRHTQINKGSRKKPLLRLPM